MKNVLKGHQLKIIIVLLSSILFGCSQEKMVLKKEKFVIEYGQPISTTLSDYLDNKDDFLKDVKIDIDGQNEKGKTYFSVGQYKVSFTHDKSTIETTVEIIDTTAPQFKDLKESYQVGFNNKFDMSQLKATDLSKVTLSIDDSQVNYAKSGTYTAIVSAKDTSGNETKEDIKIVVEEKKKEAQSSSKSSQSNSSSSSKNSSGKSKSNSSSSSSSESSTNSDVPKKGQELDSKRDENSYTEFDNGYGWGGSFELPENY